MSFENTSPSIVMIFNDHLLTVYDLLFIQRSVILLSFLQDIMIWGIEGMFISAHHGSWYGDARMSATASTICTTWVEFDQKGSVGTE